MADANEENLKAKLLSRVFWTGVAAEFLATAVFVFMVVGATLSWTGLSPSVFHIAATVGFSIAVLATAIGHLTGGQINPVVTLGFIVAKKIHPLDGVFYIIGQLVGGILGASILYGLTPTDIYRKGFGVTAPAPNLNLGQAVGIEIVLTFLLVFTIHSVTDGKRLYSPYTAPVIIGIAVFICHMVGIPFTGCSMNPARSFGPALITNTWTHHWVYWVGPVVGALIASFIYEFVFAANKARVIPDETSRSVDEHL